MPETDYEFFMQTDVDRFVGEWVAICENKIVAHGKHADVVFQEAKQKCAGKSVLLSRVPNEETMIF